MRRRPDPTPAPTFAVVDIYEYELRGHDGYVERYGEPSPELLAAVVDRRARVARGERWLR
jgi:hypothetical protein